MGKINMAADILRHKKNILALTGTGMSTASGIPDFRSKTGLYSTAPEEILSHDYFYKHPERFYEFLLTKMYYPDAKPNKDTKFCPNGKKKAVYYISLQKMWMGCIKLLEVKKLSSFMEVFNDVSVQIARSYIVLRKFVVRVI